MLRSFVAMPQLPCVAAPVLVLGIMSWARHSTRGVLLLLGMLAFSCCEMPSATCACGGASVISTHSGTHWPAEQSTKRTLRPWHYTAVGYLAVLFEDPEEAQRAQRGLRERGVPEDDLRLYDGEETLRTASRLQQQRSILAKAIVEVVVDHGAKKRWLGNARAGGRTPASGSRSSKAVIRTRPAGERRRCLDPSGTPP